MSEHTIKTPRGGTFHLWHLEPEPEKPIEEKAIVLLTEEAETAKPDPS